MNETIKEKMKSLISAYNNSRNDNILDKIYDLCQEKPILEARVKAVRKASVK